MLKLARKRDPLYSCRQGPETTGPNVAPHAPSPFQTPAKSETYNARFESFQPVADAEIKFWRRCYTAAPQEGRRPKEANMAKVVTCKDVGVDCDFVARGETEQDILQQAAEHARTAHNMTEIPAELADKVRGAIRDEAA